jgi:hypothetical protein
MNFGKAGKIILPPILDAGKERGLDAAILNLVLLHDSRNDLVVMVSGVCFVKKRLKPQQNHICRMSGENCFVLSRFLNYCVINNSLLSLTIVIRQL